MHIRFKKELEYLPPEEFTNPKSTVIVFLVYIRKLMRQYLEARHFSGRLFDKTPVSGLDAMLCKRIIAEYKHEKREKSSIQRLINCLIRSNELLDQDGEIANMLSSLFSYFPEYLPSALAPKIKLDFSWAENLYAWTESYKKAKASEIVEFIPAPPFHFDFKVQAEIKKPEDTLESKTTLTVDAAFKKLEEQNRDGDYDSDDDIAADHAVNSVVNALKTQSPEESKKVFNQVELSLSKQRQDKKYNRLSFYMLNIMISSLNEKAVPVEMIPKLVEQCIEGIEDFVKHYESDTFFNVGIGEITSLLNAEYLRAQDVKRIVDIFTAMQGIKRDINSKELVDLYSKLIHKMDLDVLKKIVIQIINSQLLDKSYELLTKIIYLKFEKDFEIQKHHEMRIIIIETLINKLKLEANEYYHSASYDPPKTRIDSVNNALCAIIPSMSFHERIRLTRKIQALGLNYVSTGVLEKLKDAHEKEKTLPHAFRA